MATLVRACLDSDFDAATGTCAHEVWLVEPSAMPELSIEGAQQIGSAILLLWAVAYVFRLIRKQLNQA